MNRRADIPITILVLGVVAICGFVLLSFEVMKNKTEENFLGVDLIEEALSIEEEYYLYQNLGKSDGEIQNLFDEYNLKFVYREGGNIFDISKIGDTGKAEISPHKITVYYLEKKIFRKDKPLFSVEYNFKK